MFIGPRVILAHSKPESGVNQLDCAIHLFKHPVAFSETDKASVVVMLAAEDQESHLKILHDIMTIFEEDEIIDNLLAYQHVEEIIKAFEKILDQRKSEV
jgi:mannitol/fructose-specific phosphotransferase system IIA component (Ntr-type)